MAYQITVYAVAAVVLPLAYMIYNFIHNVWFSPLKRYPGPLMWRGIRLPYQKSKMDGNIHRDLLKIHKKYGPVVRVGPTILSYTNDIAWRDVWAHRQGYPEFTKVTTATPVNGVQGILGADRERHSKYRRLLSHAFSAQGLQEQEPRVRQYVNMLMRGLATHAETGPLDMVAWFNWTTFDLIGDLAFGESFGCLENARTHPWIASIFGSLASIVFFNALKSYRLAFLIPYLTPKRFFVQRMENYKFAADKMSKRVPMGNTRGDFFDRVLGKSEEDGGMSIKELESNASNIVLAGSETTATQLSGTVFYLLRNPPILKRLVDDVRATFRSEEDITIRSCAEQHYLLAVLNEAMRVYPPVPTFSPRCVPNSGATVGGDYLPGGTSIEFCHYAAYRLESNFVRPEDFLPERWQADPNFRDDNQASFQPFGVGSRNCIGKNLAYAEMRLILARLLWRFDLSIPEGIPGWHQWADDQKTFILWEKSPLLVQLKDRKV